MSQNKLSAIIIFLIGEHQSPKGNEFLYTKEKKKKKKRKKENIASQKRILHSFFSRIIKLIIHFKADRIQNISKH